MAEQGILKPETTAVCTLTGHGLKDPDLALSFDDEIISVDPKLDHILKIMGI
jgi:threonine synthase